jgi:hypothetical protein
MPSAEAMWRRQPQQSGRMIEAKIRRGVVVEIQ